MQRATVEEIRAALALPGVNGQRLAKALGQAPARVSEWVTGKVERPNVTREELARAVATLTGAQAPAVDPRVYAASLLVNLEADAQAILAKIARARLDLGLVATPAAARATVADEAAGVRRRQRGRAAEG